MKKHYVILFALFILSVQTVHATLLSTQYPGGKNYIDTDNFYIQDTQISTIDSIKVKPNTYYTLSIPPTDLIGNPSIYIYGNDDYIMGTPEQNSCQIGTMIVCTFYNTDQYIDIVIESSMIGLYHSYYELELFQLEEGEISTTFEYYIPPLSDTTSPEFSNTGAYITDYNDTTTIESIVSDHVTAIDEIDGDISDRIIIVEDNYTVSKGIVGEYDVLLEVSDTAGNKAFFTLIVMVKDEIAPTVIGPEIVTIDVMDSLSVTSIIDANYTISDEYDGLLSYQILSDFYTPNIGIIGTYDVVIEVTDSSNNKTTKTIQITSKDFDAPVLESPTQYLTTVDTVEPLSEIINSLIITDNYDSSVSIEILSDTYTTNETKVGNYFVSIKATDTSLNILECTIYIEVYDNIPPTITGPNHIQISYTEPLTANDVLLLLMPQDNYSTLTQNDIEIIQDTYTTRTEEIGTYAITFRVTDEALLQAEHTVEITVIDDQVPVIFVDDYIVKINPDVTFTKQDALSLLLHSKELQEGEYEIKTLINEYIGNETIPGMYLYQVSFTNTSGETYIKDFVIEVLDNTSPPNYIPIISSITLLLSFTTYVIIKRRK